jgi:hypothetical protein
LERRLLALFLVLVSTAYGLVGLIDLPADPQDMAEVVIPREPNNTEVGEGRSQLLRIVLGVVRAELRLDGLPERLDLPDDGLEVWERFESRDGVLALGTSQLTSPEIVLYSPTARDCCDRSHGR